MIGLRSERLTALWIVYRIASVRSIAPVNVFAAVLGTHPRPIFGCDHWSQQDQRRFLRALIDLFDFKYTLYKFRPSCDESEDSPGYPSATSTVRSGDENLGSSAVGRSSRQLRQGSRKLGMRISGFMSGIGSPDTAASPTARNWVGNPTISKTTHENVLDMDSLPTEFEYSVGTAPARAPAVVDEYSLGTAPARAPAVDDEYSLGTAPDEDYALPYGSVLQETICDKQPIPVSQLFESFPEMSIQLIGGAHSALMPPPSSSTIIMSPFTFRRLYHTLIALHNCGYCTVPGSREMICFDSTSNQHLIRTSEVVAATPDMQQQEMRLFISTLLRYLDSPVIRSVEGMEVFKRTLEAHR